MNSIARALGRALPLIMISMATAGCAPAEREEPNAAASGPTTEPIASPGVRRGALISKRLIQRKSVEEMTAELRSNFIPYTPRYGVAIYKIVYETVDARGGKTVASGAIALPDGATDSLPLFSFQHGTVTNRKGVASSYGLNIGSALLASSGYVTAVPDFLGLGESPGLHPYVHARSLASSIVDMLRAVRSLCADSGLALSGELYLMGYSEGGYATMAAHREIEEHHADEFTVTASAPMAGPYDLSGTMADLFMREKSYGDPFYLPYVVLAYNDVYRVYPSLDEVFKPAYARILPELFDGTRGGSQINAKLPSVPRQMLDERFVASFQSDSTNPLRRLLRENDLYDWTPRAPMRIYHSRLDDRVPFANAEIAYRRFVRNGATSVELVPLDAGGHGSAALPSILMAAQWIDSLHRGL